MTLSCHEFRQIVGAVPDSRDPQVLEHRLQCRTCAAFAEAQAGLDRRLEAALRIPVPDDLGAQVIWSQAGSRRRRRAGPAAILAGLAAVLALAIGLGVVVGRFAVSGPLPTDVVAHIEHEPELTRLVADAPLAEPVRVNAILERGGIRAARPLENVVSAGLCPFRGRLVPHLVLRVDGEAVSVLLLPTERLDAPQEIHEDGYHGVIVPRDGGSIAIVSPRADLVVPVREQLERVVNWRI